MFFYNILTCQYPEALDPILVQGWIAICVFSAGFIMRHQASMPLLIQQEL